MRARRSRSDPSGVAVDLSCVLSLVLFLTLTLLSIRKVPEWRAAVDHLLLAGTAFAAATVMLAMFFRYRRPLFYASLPFFLTLYVSTVYGRYHYAADAVAGILVALAVIKGGPKLLAWTESLGPAIRRLPGRALREPSALAADAGVRKQGV